MATDTGGYDLEFLESPSEDFECPICHLVMKDPQIVDCCGYKYCLSCVDRITLAAKPCPMCQESKFRNMPEKQLQRKISDLKVYCVEKKHSCEWSGEIRQLETHLMTNCQFVTVSCPLKCGVSLQRCRLQAHQEDDCTQRSHEAILTSLVRKLETRLVAVETKCSTQDKEITSLKNEVEDLKRLKTEQTEKITHLEGSLKTASNFQENQLASSLRVVESELIRRCISFPVRVTTGSGSSWISPPFYSHPKGYVLQLTARLQKFESHMDSLAYSIFSSGRSPDKGRVRLSLNVLPQADDGLDWPIHVTVDVLVLTSMDENSNAKMYSLTKYKSLNQWSPALGEGDSDSSGEEANHEAVIGHSRFCFSCRLLLLNIHYSQEPPLLEQDIRVAVNDGKLSSST